MLAHGLKKKKVYPFISTYSFCNAFPPSFRNGYVCATKIMALRKILEAAGKSTGFTNEEKGDYSDIVEYIIQWYILEYFYSNANLYTKLFSHGIVKWSSTKISSVGQCWS